MRCQHKCIQKSLRSVLLGSKYTKTGKVLTTAAAALFSTSLVIDLGKSIILVIGESPTTDMTYTWWRTEIRPVVLLVL